ncbi:siderophore-interacting protein [Gryllotalpicola reticulitermitis]|uniref:Siderophore-interacting protein n=1 Tax=Gryllotalpicola reticulitermitis TaxID=1184153 RepID=A0ABV8Q533_9MICO
MAFTRERIRHDLTRRTLTVVRTTPLTARITRITLTGPELDGFTAPGPADHVKLFFPNGDSRDYTPAAFHPANDEHPDELDLDFVLHGDEGPATVWATGAQPGDELVVAGPRGSQLAPQGVNRLVIVVDETAFPAAARWLEAAGDQLPVDVLAWPLDSAPEEYFGTRVPERAAVTPYAPSELMTALRALAPFDDQTFFFLAGEATTLAPLRRYLRRELELPPEQVQASGYWRYGAAGLDHHAPIDPSDPD